MINYNLSHPGSDNGNWKGGISKVIKYCPDCGKKLGHYLSKYCRKCFSKHRVLNIPKGDNHYNWKGGKPTCSICGKTIAHKAKLCSSCSKIGSNNNNWKGGASFDNYPVKFNGILKNRIKERDKYTCAICFRCLAGTKERLVIHHIDYNKDNLDDSNLISLCNTCHVKTNYNRDKWIKYFKGDICE